MARPLNKNGRFSVGAIKADLGRASRPMDATYQKRHKRRLRALKWLLIASFVFGGVALATASALAQVVPFDGRIDSYTDGFNGSYNLEFGDFGSYHGGYYAAVEWTPTSTGIFCGFETIFESAESPIDISVSGSDILTVSWLNQTVPPGSSGLTSGFYLWPEECFTFTSGTKYRFDFSTTGGVTDSTMIWGASATPTNYVLWQYNDGLGWSVKNGHPEFTIIGTANSSTVAWYVSSTPQFPYDFNPDSDVCADWGPFTIVCRMLQWLFVPSDDAIADYDAYKTLITTKAPLGYFDATQDAFYSMMGASSTDYESVTITSSSLQTLYITASSSVMPFLDAGSTTIRMWDVEETKNSVLMQRVLPYLFTFERWALWLGFCWYLYIRIRDMYL